MKNNSNVRLKPRERLTLLSDLATMLAAGIPIVEAVSALEQDAKGSFLRVLRHIRHGLDNGEPLSDVMGRMPKVFDDITVNLIRAAEAGGTLEETLNDVVRSTKKEIAFNDTIRNATIYPLFVMGVFMAIVVLMLTFVIPRVARVFENLRVNIPTITKLTINASDFFISYWFVIIPAILVGIVLFTIFFKRHKRAVVRLLLKTPGLSKLGTNIDLTRFTRSFGLLMRSGVPLEEALRLSGNIMQRKDIAKIVKQMRVDVGAGLPLSAHLRDTDGVIPVIMARSIETAEKSGTLDKTLQQLAEYFDNEVSESIKVLTALLEPILILLVGLLVGGLMVTVIAPIYNLISQISPKS